MPPDKTPPAKPAHELHISSVVVHARPEAVPAVSRTAASLAGVEVHAATDGGKLVITLETEDEQTIVSHLNTLSLLDGVLAATLVFHHVEPLLDADGGVP
ncbi:chaperone NapD [Azospirillum sp.]|uniref:chaperone NapD n=1 Tax=Azospirillum sp. TaxID=34012 RepID=UPI002D305209|nr:chaperone NapD [Azospirillum sp.]HYD68884.1 chaperone NapD [Azospirillum sp.]